MLSEPADLDHGALGDSLDRLNALATAPGPAPRTRPRRAQPPTVQRHLLDSTHEYEKLPNERQALVGRIATPPTRIGSLLNVAERVLVAASVHAREDPIVQVAARTLAQCRTAELLALVASRTGAPSVTVPLGDATATVDTDVHVGHSTVVAWCDAWYTALVAREDRCLDALAGLTDAELVEGGSPSQHAWRAALLAYRGLPASAPSHVDQAVLLSAHFVRRYDGDAHAARTALYPALGHLARADAAHFNAAIFEALRVHRKFYGSKSMSHRREGWIALGSLALCCLAHDAGIATTVTSDYLLPALIERRFAQPAPDD